MRVKSKPCTCATHRGRNIAMFVRSSRVCIFNQQISRQSSVVCGRSEDARYANKSRIWAIGRWHLAPLSRLVPLPSVVFRLLHLAREYFPAQLAVRPRRWFHVPSSPARTASSARAASSASASVRRSRLGQMFLPTLVFLKLRVAREIHLTHLAPRSIVPHRQPSLELIPRRTHGRRPSARRRRRRLSRAALAQKRRPFPFIIVSFRQQLSRQGLDSR